MPFIFHIFISNQKEKQKYNRLYLAAEMNNFQLMRYAAEMGASAYRQHKFINSFLKPLVYKHSERLHYALSKKEKKKVLFYYPMYTVLACAQMYLALKGRRLSGNERKRLTLVGSMATICDDLIDEHNWTREQIFELLSNQFTEEGLEPKAQLLVALNKELNAFWSLQDRYLNQLKIALDWQTLSAKQLDPTITLDEIVNLCREKNGNTSLMFASLLDEDWTDTERKFIYQSAIVGQLTNDSFDIYFDTQNGLNTYVNRASSIKAVREFFIEECRKLHQYVMACNTSLKHKKFTIRRMSCMHGFTLVALDHLQQTENKYGLALDWTKPTRKEMVTDLALNKNRIKLPGAIKRLSKVI